mmetsp:Transcript_34304/g.44040  ORF Transcript_34304/g.44040 Transcript_34304/m.44040 type:complete len:303 (-) Transcript_34304:500-1408(-)
MLNSIRKMMKILSLSLFALLVLAELSQGYCYSKHASKLTFSFISPNHNHHISESNSKNSLSRKQSMRKKNEMKMLNANDDLSIVVEDLNNGVYSMSACFVSSSGMKRTWRFRRGLDDLDNLYSTLVTQYGHAMIPNPPPRSLSDAELVERYLQKLSLVHQVVSNRDFFEFVNIPPDLVDEPVYTPEIVDDDDFDFRTSSARNGGKRRSQFDEEDELASVAGIAGAAAGVVIGGIPGALIGAVAGSFAATQENAAGDFARAAAKKTQEAIEGAKELDRTYEVSRSLKKTLVKGLQKLQKLAED